MQPRALPPYRVDHKGFLRTGGEGLLLIRIDPDPSYTNVTLRYRPAKISEFQNLEVLGTAEFMSLEERPNSVPVVVTNNYLKLRVASLGLEPIPEPPGPGPGPGSGPSAAARSSKAGHDAALGGLSPDELLELGESHELSANELTPLVRQLVERSPRGRAGVGTRIDSAWKTRLLRLTSRGDVCPDELRRELRLAASQQPPGSVHAPGAGSGTIEVTLLNNTTPVFLGYSYAVPVLPT